MSKTRQLTLVVICTIYRPGKFYVSNGFRPFAFSSLRRKNMNAESLDKKVEDAAADESLIEEPTCRLTALHEDCLAEVFYYLGSYEFVQLSKYNEDFQKIIKSRVIGKKITKFRGPPTYLSKKIFELFGSSLRHIEFTNCDSKDECDHFATLVNDYCSSENLQKFSVRNITGFWWLALKNAPNLIELLVDGGCSYNRSYILDALSRMPKLRRFYCENSTERDTIGSQIARSCPQIEQFNEKCHNCHGDTGVDISLRYRFILDFENLKKVGLTAAATSSADLYLVLCGLAEKNSIEELKIFIPEPHASKQPQKQVRVMSYAFDKFTSLKSFEIEWSYFCKKTDTTFFCDLLANLRHLRKLTVKISSATPSDPIIKVAFLIEITINE